MYILLGTPPSLFLQGTLNLTPHSPSAPPQDGLNEAAGQIDKLDAKVGVGPEANRRPGKEPHCSLETNKHMDSHIIQRIWSWHAGAPEVPPCLFSIFGSCKAGRSQYKGLRQYNDTNAHVCPQTPVRMS